jgi:hypothetical protein
MISHNSVYNYIRRNYEVDEMAPADFQLVKNVLHEIATHAYALAMGLQNAAPPQELSKPIKTVQYLLETAVQLEQAHRTIEEWSSSSD